MAILQSCCCWRSLRTGSYASALYTLGYFTVMAVLMGRVLHEEREYLQGNASAPQTSSVLEPHTISHAASLALSAVWLFCASSGILTSLLLIYGIYRDNRLLLVPWILNVGATLPLDVVHVAALLAHGVEVEPIKAMLFTFDFFLISLNLYALLCVVSQYQEYRAGRGTAAHQRNSPKTVAATAAAAAAAAVRYAPRPTATSLLSSRRPTMPGAAPAPSPPSPSAPGGPDAPSAAGAPAAAAPASTRKHVQFPSPVTPPITLSPAADDEMVSTTESGGGASAAAVVMLWAAVGAGGGGGGGGGGGSSDDGRRPPDTAPLIAPRGYGARGHGGGILRTPK